MNYKNYNLLKKVYEAMAKRCHPDSDKCLSGANDYFSEITAIYSTISDKLIKTKNQKPNEKEIKKTNDLIEKINICENIEQFKKLNAISTSAFKININPQKITSTLDLVDKYSNKQLLDIKQVGVEKINQFTGTNAGNDIVNAALSIGSEFMKKFQINSQILDNLKR